MDSRGGYVSKILYVKMKEFGPLGACAGHAPSRSANACDSSCIAIDVFLTVIGHVRAINRNFLRHYPTIIPYHAYRSGSIVKKVMVNLVVIGG